jgi:hypothetical protein
MSASATKKFSFKIFSNHVMAKSLKFWRFQNRSGLRNLFFVTQTKNKTQKNLTPKVLLRYKARVTKVAAFETDKGIGEQCGDASFEGINRRLLIPVTP